MAQGTYPSWYSSEVWPRWLQAEGGWAANDKGSPSYYGVRFSDNQPALKAYGITDEATFKKKFTQGMARQIIWDRYIEPVSDILEGWDPDMRKVGGLFAGNVGGGPAAIRRRWKDGTIKDLESLQRWGAESYREIYGRSPERYTEDDLVSWGRRLDPTGKTSLLAGDGSMAGFGPMGVGNALQQTLFAPPQPGAPAGPAPARAQYANVNYPAPPRTDSEEAYKTALSEVRSLMMQDVVNAPKRPDPMPNPYMNPFVQLGMALQGNANQAVQAGAQIDAMNQARQDKYDADLLQAENYRLLRKQKLGTTLAGMQAEAARAGIADERWGYQMEVDRLAREQAARQFEAGQQLSEDQLAFQREQATALAEYRNAQLSQTTSFTDFLTKKENEQFANEYYGASDALSMYQRLGTIPGVDLADPNMSPAKKTAAVEAFTAKLYAIADRMRRMGFIEQSRVMYDEIGTLEKVEKETIRDFHGGVDIEGASTSPEQALERRRLAESPDKMAPGFDPMGDFQSFEYLDSVTRQNVLETLETPGGKFTEEQQAQMDVQVASGRMNEGLQANAKYLGSPAGQADLKRLARAVALDVSFTGQKTPQEAAEWARFRLSQEFGVPDGFLNKGIMDIVTSTIKREVFRSQGAAQHRGRGQRALRKAFGLEAEMINPVSQRFITERR